MQIWNLDKLAFPTDTGRCTVIAPKGGVVKKIISGAGSKNITALPACHALGKVIELLAIFTAKNFQLSWKGDFF